LFGVGTPLGAPKVDFRIDNIGSTRFAPSADIVLEKFDLLLALRAGNVENIPWFPIS
jgi:hypothetical protein